MFFVISGFLIASQSIARWGALAAIDVRAFWTRRAARILPCLAILVTVLVALDAAGVADCVVDRSRACVAGAAGAAFGLHLNWYEARHGLLPPAWDVLWSLSIEEAFYLGFPLACLVFGRWRAMLLPLALFALSLPATRAAIHHDEIWREKAYLPGMAAIATGVLAALLVAGWPTARRGFAAAVGAFGAAGLVASLFFDEFAWHWLHGNAMLLLTLSSAALVIAAQWRHATGAARPSRAFGWLRSFGRLSYEVYLSHMFVVLAIARLFAATGGDVDASVAWLVTILAGAWGLGRVVERGVSMPAGRALARRLSGGHGERADGVATGGAA